MKWVNKGHELDILGEKIKKIKKVYLYGIGGYAQEIWELMELGKKWFDWEKIYVDQNDQESKTF